MRNLPISAARAFTPDGALSLYNLRPAAASTAAALAIEQCPRPVRHYTGTALPLIARGDDTILADGNVLSREHSDGTVTPLATLPAAPDVAIPSGDELLLMTRAGARRLIFGDSAESLPATLSYPPVSLTAVDVGPAMAGVSARTLSQVYTGGTLAARDRDALLADLADAYRSIVASAAAAGAMPQPAIARYRLRTADGRLLFTSPPVLLSLAAGTQCSSAVEVYSTDRCTVSAYTLSASCWQLHLDAPASADADMRRAAVLEVYLTPPLHPYRSGARGTATLGTQGSSSTPFARLTLPGSSYAIDSARSAGAELTLRSLLARLDDVERCVATVNDPFGSGAGVRTLALPLSADADADNALIDSALRRSAPVVPYTTRMLGAPHTFTAAVGAVGSGVVAWGDITVHRYDGHSAAAFVALDGVGQWTATTRVRFADGSAVIRTESFNTGAPTAFSPILSYPAPDAVELTIVAFYGGVNHRLDVPLTPDPSRGMAVYIHPGMRPFALPEASAAQLIQGEPRAIELPSLLAFARHESPLDIIAHTTLAARPESIVHAAAVQQSWEYGRTRFVISSAAGIDSCTVNISVGGTAIRSLLSSSLAPSCLCPGDPGEVFAAIADTVYLITGSRIRSVGARGDCRGIAYDRARSELWSLTADGTVRVLCRRYAWAEYRCAILRYTSFSTAPGFFCALGDGFYARPDTATIAVEATVSLHIAVPADSNSDNYSGHRPRHLIAACTASHFDGSISLRTPSALHRRPVTLGEAFIDGSIDAPLVILAAPRPVRAFEIAIAATTSGFRLAGLTLQLL
ncbi:MAG: hypothetical protein K2M55_07205 [Muribaculaceae bacterium]|nr:hypothetical protein [Muribaculaceae bacterium]